TLLIVNFRCCGYHYYGGYVDYIKGLPLAPHRCRSAPHQLPLATAVCMQLLEQAITQQEKEADSIEQFILRAKKYPNLQELTPAVLHDLVNRVYVSAPDKSSGQRVQDVHISLACIGFLPESIIAEMLTHASKSRTA
ncbi:MAG: DUF4368 domain-containing protein, partial [Oscillibacter sp.]|nr:DUF4368 domain-containing protein [Oscillibacter sp.]